MRAELSRADPRAARYLLRCWDGAWWLKPTWLKVPALSDSNTSNWVLESHPNVYLFGALSHAESFLVNEEKEQEYRSKFAIALNGIAGRDLQRMVHGAQMTSAAGVSIG